MKTTSSSLVMAPVEEEVEKKEGDLCNSDIASDENQGTDNKINIDTAVAVGCSSAAVVGAVPLAVVGTVQTIGFSTSGIMAGSTAAAMMAAEAVATGGGVAAGGTVATLQSIGAIGMAGAMPIAGIVILSAGAATAIGYGIFRCVETFTKVPSPSKLPPISTFSCRKVSIKAQNGKYLKALGGGRGNWYFDWQSDSCYTGVIKAEADEAREWETFTVHPHGGDYFTLQSHHGAYLCAEIASSRDMIANVLEEQRGEKFRFLRDRDTPDEKDMDQTIWKGYFQTQDGTFMTINHQYCHFTANANDFTQAELFEVHVIKA